MSRVTSESTDSHRLQIGSSKKCCIKCGLYLISEGLFNHCKSVSLLIIDFELRWCKQIMRHVSGAVRKPDPLLSIDNLKAEPDQ